MALQAGSLSGGGPSWVQAANTLSAQLNLRALWAVRVSGKGSQTSLPR